MQPIRITTGMNEKTSLKNKEVEPVEPVQMNIYQINTFKKDLGCLHLMSQGFEAAREGLTVLHAYLFFVAYLTVPVSN